MLSSIHTEDQVSQKNADISTVAYTWCDHRPVLPVVALAG
jgi:hypothetical protein